MAQGIRVNDGWRRMALISRIDATLDRDITPDTPELQTAFDVVCSECKDLLTCGSTLAVASGRSLEYSAEMAHLDRETFRSMVRCLWRCGVLGRLPGVSSRKRGYLFGVPSEYGALDAYDFSSYEGLLRVLRRGAMRDRVVATLGVRGGVASGCFRERPHGQDHSLESLREINALYALGLNVAPALVRAYGPARCRQVRQWAMRRLGSKLNARLVFATLMKYPPRDVGSAFNCESVRECMRQETALDEKHRARYNL